MTDTLVILIHDRLQNLKDWFHILKQCDRPKNIVVIHNDNGQDWRVIVEGEGAIYIKRKNIGFDIGAFQDVCRNRLPGFPDWEQLLWVTDDCFPMQKDFIKHFALQPGEGVRCMEISPYVRRHIRTTGFSISKTTARKLIFPADPIVSKQHCYLFEHRHSINTFLSQIEGMGLQVRMVAPRETSPLFDTNYHRRQDRDNELKEMWGIDLPEKKEVHRNVTIICPIYKSFPAVISSLIMQTYPGWELWLIHDGPDDGFVRQYVELINDDRIKFFETDHHKGNWGHYIRSEYLQKVQSEYVLITNPDNYYMPPYLKKAIAAMRVRSVATYPNQIVHSYTDWRVMDCRLKRGFIDCGQALMKTKKVQEVGWRNVDEHSADWIFFNDIAIKYGAQSFTPFNSCVFVHN